MCLNLTAWYIRSTEGYSISKDKNRKAMQNLFVDDLKTYHKSQKKATLITNTVKGVFEDFGLSWGVTEMRSCAHKERKNNGNFRASAYKRRQHLGPRRR